VTAVDAGSPADGVLRVNDVILGVAGKPFADDARISLARAITAAEEKSGVLRVICWRDGQNSDVDLKLPVLGTYSATAPYGCPKSKAIFEQGCRVIAKDGLKRADIPIDLNALALLASGNREYHPMLAEYARKVAASLHPGVWTWYYGYGNVFLAEYVMATGDKAILAELKRTTKESIVGQSAVGTWGHEFYATPGGNLNGYGCMNLPGLVMTTGLVLARQAGVDDPAVRIVQADSRTPRAANAVSRVLEEWGEDHAQLLMLHPPYHDIIRFSDMEGDLSNAATTEDFLHDFSAIARRGFRLLEPGRFAVLIIGDKYAGGELVPLGFFCMQAMMEAGFRLKSVVVKNVAGNEIGKGPRENLWRYRALRGGFYLFKHEYVMIMQKPER